MTAPIASVRVHHAPLFIELDPSEFGRIFAHMNDCDQVAVLREMVEHMRPHKQQWDYIAIELKKPENREVSEELFGCLQFAMDETL